MFSRTNAMDINGMNGDSKAHIMNSIIETGSISQDVDKIIKQEVEGFESFDSLQSTRISGDSRMSNDHISPPVDSTTYLQMPHASPSPHSLCSRSPLPMQRQPMLQRNNMPQHMMQQQSLPDCDQSRVPVSPSNNDAMHMHTQRLYEEILNGYGQSITGM